MKDTFLYSIILICSMSCIALGEIQFRVTTDQNQALLGDQIIISATIVSSKELKGFSPPPFPTSEYYSVTRTEQNQSQSSQIQIINGKMSQTREITYLVHYYLTLQKEGTCTIQSLQFSSEGKTYTSQPFTVSIGKQQSQHSTELVSVTLSVNKQKLYRGEQAILAVEVVKKAQAPCNLSNEGFIALIERVEQSFGKNFSVNRLFIDKLQQSQRVINGQPYEVFGLSFSIIGLNDGAYQIPSLPFPYEELRQIRSSQNDIFNDFFNNSFFEQPMKRIPRAAQSNQLAIHVLPLPAQPSNFSGAVGTFSLDAVVNPQTVSAGESVTLTVSLSGSTRPGNISDIVLPELPSFDVFTPEKQVLVDTTAQGISTKKRFKYLLVPKQSGEVTIPPISWSYFDPNKGDYVTIRTQPLPLQVTPSTKIAKTAERFLSQADIKELGQDIRYIKTTSSLKKQSATPYLQPVFLMVVPVPFLLVLFSVLFRFRSEIIKKNPKELMKRKALRIAQTRLLDCKKISPSTNAHIVLGKIASAIEDYISQKFDFIASGMTLDQLKLSLKEHVLDQATIDMLIPLLEKIDSYRFSGLSAQHNELNKLVDTAMNILEKLQTTDGKK